MCIIYVSDARCKRRLLIDYAVKRETRMESENMTEATSRLEKLTVYKSTRAGYSKNINRIYSSTSQGQRITKDMRFLIKPSFEKIWNSKEYHVDGLVTNPKITLGEEFTKKCNSFVTKLKDEEKIKGISKLITATNENFPSLCDKIAEWYKETSNSPKTVLVISSFKILPDFQKKRFIGIFWTDLSPGYNLNNKNVITKIENIFSSINKAIIYPYFNQNKVVETKKIKIYQKGKKANYVFNFVGAQPPDNPNDTVITILKNKSDIASIQSLQDTCKNKKQKLMFNQAEIKILIDDITVTSKLNKLEKDIELFIENGKKCLKIKGSKWYVYLDSFDLIEHNKIKINE
jgi:predicted nucleic acid-binding protein